MSKSQPKTFMLLPDNMHKPDDKIHLGTVLQLCRDTKLPNPDAPLNDRYTLVSPDPSNLLQPLTEEPWAFANGRVITGSAAINVEIPVFTPVGGGFVLGRSKSDNLTIKCDRVETQRFHADDAYLNKAVADRNVQTYCRGRYFPSVYLVTGIKVAYNANIGTASEAELNAEISGSVDTTALTGVPVNVKLSPAFSESKNRKLDSGIKEGFILAYQLRRLKMRRDGTMRKHEPHNSHALFDDDASRTDAQRTEIPFSDIWQEEEVTPETSHDT